jgi:hypothetical protein
MEPCAVGTTPHCATATDGAYCPVKIKSINRSEFNQLLPQHRQLEDLMGNQIAWYSNAARTLIGTIAETMIGRSWNFAVLKRNRLGKFQVCDIGENFFNLRQTVAQFHHALTATKNCLPLAFCEAD